jgi:hypothetical protein
MHVIRPLPVELIVTIAETLRGHDVLIDGYDGAALVGAVAEVATATVAYRPHLYGEFDDAQGLADYVTGALGQRGVRNVEIHPDTAPPQTWEFAGIGKGCAVLIDPGPDDVDVPRLLRAALVCADIVVVIDQRDRYTSRLYAMADSESFSVTYGNPAVVYVFGRGARLIIPIGGQ